MSAIAGMRDRIAYGYLGVNAEAVWAVVCERLVPLRAEAARIRDLVPPPEPIA